MRLQAGQHGCAAINSSATPPARGKVNVDEREVPNGDELHIAQCEVPHWGPEEGQDGKCAFGWSREVEREVD
jgi:hypothetical protein